MASKLKSVGGEILVNSYTAGDQAKPGIGANPATGGFQVVWQSEGQDGTIWWGVYGQNFDAKGAPVGDEFGFADLTDGDQESPDVAFNEDGNGMWVWQSTYGIALSAGETSPPTPGSNTVAYHVRSKSFGFEAGDGGEKYVNYEVDRGNKQTNAKDDLIDISVQSLGGDRFLTSWYSKDEPRDEYVLEVEMIDTDTKVSIDPTGEISYAYPEPFGKTNWGDVAPLRSILDRTSGRELTEFVVVASESETADATGGAIKFQIFQENRSTDLAFLYDDTLDTDYNGRYDVGAKGQTGSASKPKVAVLDNGDFAITWQERDERSNNEKDWNSDVYVQVFDGEDLSPRTGRVAVHDTDDSDQTLPEIVAAKGGFVIAYNDYSGADADVMLQRFDSNGIRVGEAHQANATTSGDQSEADLAVLKNGKIAVTWESGDEGERDVSARIVTFKSDSAKSANYYIGTDNNETFNTKNKADFVSGGGGKDRIKGGNGDDDLYGDGGNDVIDGGSGKDMIDGGEGNDKLKGRGDADKFVFSAGKDKILDFQDDVDTVLFDKDLADDGKLNAKSLKDYLVDESKDSIQFDFGKHELTVFGVSSFKDFADDVGFV